jgi:regulatory protein YycI of two-component signal transduction system YycFG
LSNLAETENNDIIAFGMTRQVVIDAVNDIEKEYTINEQDSINSSEYAKHMKEGREILKKQAGYYPYLPRENQ